jgi:multidrug efflux pump subunit AcrA (membrane-fusion protein)
MFARAAITTTTTTGVTVPSKAVLPQPDGSAIVFLLSGEDNVQARKVEVGEVANGSSVEIKKGLQSGDRVVVDGAGFLKDGDRVRIVSQ